MARPKKYRTHKVPMSRINISIYDGLLELVDNAAEEDFTTRSDIIRSALLWYLRPQGRQLQQVGPDAILKTLQRRRASALNNREMRDLDLDVYDG
jgi:metal-responsive CopG/Arc/MetJ family transcriptional regulator